MNGLFWSEMIKIWPFWAFISLRADFTTTQEKSREKEKFFFSLDFSCVVAKSCAQAKRLLFFIDFVCDICKVS